jgi:hypothetical protein
MYHFKRSLFIVLIVSIFTTFSIVFYKYSTVKLNILKQAQAEMESNNAKINEARQKLQILKNNELILRNINTNTKTTFNISFLSDNLKEVISQINNLYSSGIFVAQNAKIQSLNGTIKCTVNGTRLGP